MWLGGRDAVFRRALNRINSLYEYWKPQAPDLDAGCFTIRCRYMDKNIASCRLSNIISLCSSKQIKKNKILENYM